jgi:glycosyltransferase involved in cell wall biosynthesis
MKRKVYPYVSFIIPTLNEEVNLPKCLSAIRKQKYPQNHIEIIVADGGSKDKTISIAKKFHAKVISNPDVLHEQGKARATQIAKGNILFFTDADNVLAHDKWILQMVKPGQDDKRIIGFLPQTIGAPDTNGLDKYLGNLFTDPFTWFVYGFRANPKDYYRVFDIIIDTEGYKVFDFTKGDFPLFGLSQGVGTRNSFKRNINSYADDLLSGIQLIREQGLVAYVPSAGIYHYHVSGLNNFIRKYQWRIRNNLKQQIKGMGLVNRLKFFSAQRKLRMYLFVPYGLSIIFPLIDAIRLSIIHKDFIMFWHIPASFILSVVIISEYIQHIFQGNAHLGTYE